MQSPSIFDKKRGNGHETDLDRMPVYLLSRSIITLLSKISIVLSGLGINFLIAKNYGAAEVGIISLLSTIISVGSIIGVCGMNTAILKLLPVYIASYSSESLVYLYRKGLKMINLVSVPLAILIIGGSQIISVHVFSKPYLTPYLMIAGVVMLPNIWYEYNSSVLRAAKFVVPVAVYTVLINIFRFIAVLLICIADMNAEILICVILLFYAAFNIPLYMLSGKYFNRYSTVNTESKMTNLKELYSVSFPMLVTSSAALTITYMDMLMLGAWNSEKDLGIYSMSVRLAQVIVFVLASVNSVSASHFSELFNSGRMNELKQVVRKSTRIIIMLSLPAGALFMICGEYILSLFGDEFRAGYASLLFLVAGKMVSAACGSVGYLLNMTGFQNIYRNIVLVSCLINIVLNIILIPVYGINGAAFATMISIMINNISALFFVRIKFGFWTF